MHSSIAIYFSQNKSGLRANTVISQQLVNGCLFYMASCLVNIQKLMLLVLNYTEKICKWFLFLVI